MLGLLIIIIILIVQAGMGYKYQLLKCAPSLVCAHCKKKRTVHITKNGLTDPKNVTSFSLQSTCMYMYICVRACVRACVHACVLVCACVYRIYQRLCVYVS